MDIEDKKLTEILLKQNYLSEDEINNAIDYITKFKISLSNYLLEQNILTKDLLGQAIAESFGVLYSDLNSNKPSKKLVMRIPEEIARNFRCILFNEDKNKKTVTITTDNPKQKDLSIELAKMFSDSKVVITYSLTEDIDNLLVYYRKPLETRFSKIIEGQTRIAPNILDEIFEDANTFHASDIHFEPHFKEVVIRFRVDGVLQEAGRIPKEHYENILNRIKVQSLLRIDEHFSAQDGSLRYEKGNKSFDIRTSIVPTVEGEKVVLRILSAYVKGFNLYDLGLAPYQQKLLEAAARKPFGMILVTGPTGSGKTTTLYAILKLLNNPEVNITTIEDPVEYKILGVNQIQVNLQTNLTFSKGLRSIVRQDPDTILVGEIRDEETAEIAVNAALTGHLLLSTFHANDASTAIPRLLDMNIEPFLLASTLEIIVAQRLVRKICESCRHSISISKNDIKEKYAAAEGFFSEENITLYAGNGCETCGNTGYNGRTAIFEIIRITAELQELILKNPSTGEIWKLAQKQGARSLFENGVEKVKNGTTTLEELLRVAPPPRK